MKVLHVSKLYPPAIGGVETVVAQYARFATARGAQVSALVCQPQLQLKTAVETLDDVRVIRCASLGTLRSMPISPAFPWWLNRVMNEVDLIHLHEPFPLGALSIVMTRPRAPLIVTWHSDIVRQNTLRKLVQPAQLATLGRASLITTTSPKLAESSQILQRFSEKVEVLPLSIEADCEVPVVPPTELALPSRYALFISRDSAYKGLDVLVRALPMLSGRGYKVVIAGGAAGSSLAVTARRDHPDLVQLVTKQVSSLDKQYLLSRCSVLCFPSTMPSEAFGIMQLEAMAFGKPVVNTSLPTGVPWVSAHEVSGLTVPPNDPNEFAHAINLLMTIRVLRDRLGEGARSRVQSMFTNKAASEKMWGFYRRLAPSS